MRLASLSFACLFCSPTASHCLTVRPSPTSFVRERFTPLGLSQAADGNGINGEDGSRHAAGLIRAEDTKSQLFAAFTSLGEGEQYDAVLTGLCAKLLENESVSGTQALEMLKDPLELLDEMNRRRIRASPRSIMALIDSATRTQSARAMAEVLSLSRKNSAINKYGNSIPAVLALPLNPNSKVRDTTRSERLSKVTVPSDEREVETSAALAFASVMTACIFVDVVHWDDVTTYSNLFLVALLVLGIVDNFYEVLSFAVKLASKESAANVPDKEDLPFGLGSGKLSGNVVRGLTRLATVDAERESMCEAAALMVAYQLGLPCFAFRPNALEGSILVIESTNEKSVIAPPLNTPSGIVRMLVWLLAPVAIENSKHSQLVCSDPREAEGFLRRLEEYNNENSGSIPWDVDEDREDLIKWAYAEADLLLRDNKKLVEELSKCLTSGAGTIGDCVAAIEGW